MRALTGLIIGFLLFAFGVPLLQALVKFAGWFDHPTTEQACLGLILIVLCVSAAQLTSRSPSPPEESVRFPAHQPPAWRGTNCRPAVALISGKCRFLL